MQHTWQTNPMLICFEIEMTIFNDFFVWSEKWHHFRSVIPQPILNGKFTSINEKQLHHIHLDNINNSIIIYNNNNNINNNITNTSEIVNLFSKRKTSNLTTTRKKIFFFLYLNVKLRNRRKSLSVAWFSSNGVQPTYFTCPHPKWKFSAFLKTVWKWFKYFVFFSADGNKQTFISNDLGWKTDESLYCCFFPLSKIV